MAVVAVVELTPLWQCHLVSMAVDSVAGDRLAFLWQGHLASLVIGIGRCPVQNLMCFRTTGGQCQSAGRKVRGKDCTR